MNKRCARINDYLTGPPRLAFAYERDTPHVVSIIYLGQSKVYRLFQLYTFQPGGGYGARILNRENAIIPLFSNRLV